MPGSSARRAAVSAGSAPGSRLSRPVAAAVASARRVRWRLVVSPSRDRSAPASSAGAGNSAVSPGGLPGGAGGPCWAASLARERAGRGHRDLLAEHRAHGQLEPVVAARHAQPGPGPDQRGEQAVRGQRGVDGRRVGVGVQHPAAAGRQLADRAGRAEPGPEQHVTLAGTRDQLDDGGAARGAHRPGVAVRGHLLHPGDGPRGQETEQPGRVERLPAGQPYRQAAGRRPASCPDSTACHRQRPPTRPQRTSAVLRWGRGDHRVGGSGGRLGQRGPNERRHAPGPGCSGAPISAARSGQPAPRAGCAGWGVLAFNRLRVCRADSTAVRAASSSAVGSPRTTRSARPARSPGITFRSRC